MKKSLPRQERYPCIYPEHNELLLMKKYILNYNLNDNRYTIIQALILKIGVWKLRKRKNCVLQYGISKILDTKSSKLIFKCINFFSKIFKNTQ